MISRLIAMLMLSLVLVFLILGCHRSDDDEDEQEFRQVMDGSWKAPKIDDYNPGPPPTTDERHDVYGPKKQ
jgi:hypothetical protein